MQSPRVLLEAQESKEGVCAGRFEGVLSKLVTSLGYLATWPRYDELTISSVATTDDLARSYSA
jgi:hypothetical protein